jgi:hypothetical protein
MAALATVPIQIKRYLRNALVMLFGFFLMLTTLGYADVALAENTYSQDTHNTSKGGEQNAPEWYPDDSRSLRQMMRDVDVKEGVDRVKSADDDAKATLQDKLGSKVDKAKTAIRDTIDDAQDVVQNTRSRGS